MQSAILTPSAQKIDRIIKRVDDGDIKIPAFQRGYVWKQDQILSLLDSVVSEYPIGSILLWKTDERLKSTRNIAGYNIPDRDSSYPVHYALDGQQRVASLYGVFSQLLTQEVDTTGYNANLDIFEIYYDFDKCIFVEKSGILTERSTIHLRELLNVTTLISALATLDSKYHNNAQDLASQFLNYEIPVVTIENRNRDDVGIIFERINNTGTRLSALDLMTAWTWTDDFHLLESCNSVLEELEEKGFGNIKHKTLLQIISAVIQNSTVSKNIISLTGDQVRDNWDRIVENLKKAVDFLATDTGCMNIDFLPFAQQLIPIVKFFDLIAKPSAEELQVLRKYFWVTSFSFRYSTGQTNAKMDSDIERLIKLKSGDLTCFDDYSYTISEPVLRGTKFSKGNAITRAFLLLMAQSQPLDLVKNQKIDLDKSLAKYNRKEYHHVFPQAFLKQQGRSHDQIFCVLNFCFLSSDSNKAISKKSPSIYFFELIPSEEFNSILASNLLPNKKALYQKDAYDEFLYKRANILLSKLDALIS